MKSKLIPMAAIAAVAAVNLNAQVVISTFNSPVTVDFDSGLAGVNNGAFAGTGIVADPSAGQLDSDAWRVTGLSAGDTTFGGDFTAASFTRGFSTGGGSTASGLHAFDVGGGNRTMGIQPLAGDFNPGTITLRIQNNTGGTVDTWDLSYDLFVLNDQNRSHSWNWAWSTDDTTYTNLDTYESVRFADTEPAWSNVASPAESGLSASVADGGYLYLQWSGAHFFGTGGYDEFAIDNISVTAVPEPATGALLVGGLGLLLVLRRRRQ